MEFFNDLSVPVKFGVAFVVVLAVLGVGGYLMRRFTTGNLAVPGPRGRQQRLTILDSASVDGRRRLVLVRRDNVEHLLLIGGPTDVVVEPNIDRTGAAATAPLRDTKPSLPLEPPPRQTMSLEGSGWPPSEPVYVEPPAPRPVREAIAREPTPLEAIAREPMSWEPISREPVPREPMPREPLTREPLTREAVMAREPATREPMTREVTREAMLRPPPVPVERQRLEALIEDAGAPPLLPTPPEPGPAFYPPPVPPSFEPVAHAPPAPPPFEPVFQIPPAPEPKRMPAAPPLPQRVAQNEESNLAEMAQRLEAALRRPIKPVEPVPSPPPPGPRFTSAPAPLPTPPARPVPLREVPPVPTAREPATPAFPKEPVPELKVVPADRPPPSFTSIEEEMASLLGRSTGKS
jgi:flagellar protein FliO/FliZ